LPPGFQGQRLGGRGKYEPSALHAKLLEKGGSDDFRIIDESIRVQQRTPDNRHENDGEAAAEDLRGVADDGAAGHGAEVCDDLGDGDCVGGEAELVLEHGGVEILGPMGHEVEAGHEDDLCRLSEWGLLGIEGINWGVVTMYRSRIQCFFNATLPSAMKVPVRLPVAWRTSLRSIYAFVSGRHNLKIMRSTGGHAPNQNKGLQP